MQPPGRWLQLATGSPNAAGASDGPFQSRLSMSFGAANSPGGFVSNANAVTSGSALSAAPFGSMTAASCTVVGWNLYDSKVNGTRIAYGTLSASFTMTATDTLSIAASRLAVMLT